jgi:hypothetical protein
MSSISNLLGFLHNDINEFKSDDQPDIRKKKLFVYLYNKLQKWGIDMKYSLSDDIIHLTSSKNNLRYLAQQCNGMVLKFNTDQNTLTPICVPPYVPLIVYDKKNLNLSEYVAYELEDGTVISVYYNGTKWIINTHGGFNMNDVEWCQNTYQHIVDDCFSQFGIWDKLDPANSYTFVISHPLWHYTTQKDVWFVAQWNMNSGHSYTTDICKSQTQIPSYKVDTFSGLMDVVRLLPYGVLLRNTRDHSCIMFESALMRQLRQMIYSKQLVQKAKQECPDIPHTQYIYYYSLLNHQRYESFKTLFPEIERKYNILWDIAGMIPKGGNADNMLVRYFRERLPSWQKESQKTIFEYMRQEDYVPIIYKYFTAV